MMLNLNYMDLRSIINNLGWVENACPRSIERIIERMHAFYNPFFPTLRKKRLDRHICDIE